MTRDQVKCVVRTVLMVIARIAKKTTTQADDLMLAALESNQERLVDAVQKLLADGGQMPTDDQVAQALSSVGIKV